MTSRKRHSLWLSPIGETYDRWQALITAFGARLATPVFDPHVTLLGNLDGEVESLQPAVRALACEIEPLELQLGRVTQRDEYYRCLFIEVEPSPALQRAHKLAARHLGTSPAADFYPHLSLVYGDLTAPRKQQLIDELGARIDEPLRLEQLTLIEVANGPDTWRCRARVPLGGDDSSI